MIFKLNLHQAFIRGEGTNVHLRCYERLKSMQKRVFLTAFFKNREQMVEQVVKYFFSQNPFPVSEFAYCDRKCVKFDT